MKKINLLAAVMLLIAVSLFAPTQSHAQRVTTLTPTAAKDTITNTDTAYIYIWSGAGSSSSGVADGASMSVQSYVKKVSGTAAGYINFQGTIDGTNWKTIATDTLANSTTQTFVQSMRNSAGLLQYLQYRMVFYSTGTWVGVPKLYYLRRS